MLPPATMLFPEFFKRHLLFLAIQPGRVIDAINHWPNHQKSNTKYPDKGFHVALSRKLSHFWLILRPAMLKPADVIVT